MGDHKYLFLLIIPYCLKREAFAVYAACMAGALRVQRIILNL